MEDYRPTHNIPFTDFHAWNRFAERENLLVDPCREAPGPDSMDSQGLASTALRREEVQ